MHNGHYVMEPKEDCETLEALTEARALAPNIRAAEELATLATGTSVADEIRAHKTEPEYPVIRTLVDRQNHYASMLAEAERMGDEDLQIVLLEKTKLSPLEEDILRYWRRHHSS